MLLKDNLSSEKNTAAAGGNGKSHLLLFGCIVLLWIIADRISKSYFASELAGNTVIGPFFNLFQFSLVHNTGGAWGIFSNSTQALGIFSLVICAAFFAYTLFEASRMGIAEITGSALIVAGGIGNAIDRFTFGFVVDFIEPVFIDFPVFNIADIGVVCGCILFFIGLFVRSYREDKMLAALTQAPSSECEDR